MPRCSTSIGLDFARILRAMLRQAPNIILVGEIRDKETAEIAIQAALTGHLVFSTLHTNDAPSALTRLIDMGVKPFLVSTAVMAVMAQRLVRRLCLTCRQPMADPSAVAARRRRAHASGARRPDDLPRGRLPRVPLRGLPRAAWASSSCSRWTPRLREATFRGASTMELRDQARLTGGLKSLREDGVRKMLEGVTTIEEVLTVAEREDLTDAPSVTALRDAIAGRPALPRGGRAKEPCRSPEGRDIYRCST